MRSARMVCVSVPAHIAIVAGLAYIYMVAAWGGYIFVINMIGVHAAALVPLRYAVMGEGVRWSAHCWFASATPSCENFF